MVYVISDFNHVCSVLRSTLRSIEKRDLLALKEEFHALNKAGPNPRKYDTEEQWKWMEKLHREEDRLVTLYGGEPCGRKEQPFTFGVETFIGWLCKEKHFEKISYTDFCLAEYD